jgi:hypothetical protein
VTTSTADFEILGEARPSLFGNVRYFVALVRTCAVNVLLAVILHGDLAQVIGAPAAMLAGVRQRIAVNHLAIGIFYKWLRPVHTVMGVLGCTGTWSSSANRRGVMPTACPGGFSIAARSFRTRSRKRPATAPRARARFGIPADATVLLNVGNLSEQKNQQILITAMADSPMRCSSSPAMGR